MIRSSNCKLWPGNTNASDLSHSTIHVDRNSPDMRSILRRKNHAGNFLRLPESLPGYRRRDLPATRIRIPAIREQFRFGIAVGQLKRLSHF
jgi:hypothetical protein